MRCVKAPENPDRPLLCFLTEGHLIGIALAEECVFHAACTINKDDRHVISAGPRQVGSDIILLIILFERGFGRGAAEIVDVELCVTDDVRRKPWVGAAAEAATAAFNFLRARLARQYSLLCARAFFFFSGSICPLASRRLLAFDAAFWSRSLRDCFVTRGLTNGQACSSSCVQAPATSPRCERRTAPFCTSKGTRARHGFEGASIELAGEGASKPSPPDAESGDAMAARNANGLEGLSIDGLSIDCLSGAR